MTADDDAVVGVEIRVALNPEVLSMGRGELDNSESGGKDQKFHRLVSAGNGFVARLGGRKWYIRDAVKAQCCWQVAGRSFESSLGAIVVGGYGLKLVAKIGTWTMNLTFDKNTPPQEKRAADSSEA